MGTIVHLHMHLCSVYVRVGPVMHKLINASVHMCMCKSVYIHLYMCVFACALSYLSLYRCIGMHVHWKIYTCEHVYS